MIANPQISTSGHCATSENTSLKIPLMIDGRLDYCNSVLYRTVVRNLL